MATMPTMAARAVRDHELWTPFGLHLAILRRGRSLRKDPNSLHVTELEMVARDGIEPPTPAFSGLRSTD
jgi:hypothetical protein